MKNIVITLIATAFLIAAGSASACAMAGKNKHIGSVVSVDMDAMTFTILDAATSNEISFSASKQLLSMLSDNSHVKVSYKAADNGQLVTVALQYI